MDKKVFARIFESFVLLDSGNILLEEYLNNIDETVNDKYKRLIAIKKLAEKNLNTKILDDLSLPALIREVNLIFPIQKNKVKQNKNSFKDILYEEDGPDDQKFILNNYIYNSSIIYVDSIQNFPNACETILKVSKIHETNKTIFSHAIEKPKIFLNRYRLVKNFLFQNNNFKTKFQKNSDGLEINNLDNLQGIPDEVCVLGMLILNEEGKIQLQDERKVINLNVDETEWGKGYFTPGCIILAQGVYKNQIFKARAILHPMAVENNMTFREMYESDYFGAITKAFKSKQSKDSESSKFQEKNLNNINFENNKFVNLKPEENFLMNFLQKDLTEAKYILPKNSESYIQANYENLKKTTLNTNNLVDRIFNATTECLSEEFMLVISNADLTNDNVLLGIDKIIQGYNTINNQNSVVPFMIVFLGNFVPENSYNSFKSFTSCLENLTNIIAKNPFIAKNSYIVLIPGPDDFSLFSGFPKFPLNETFINILKKKIPNVIAATNPCRFSIFGKEFVFYRDNINKNLSRNSIVKCDQENNRDYYIHTIMCQGYLSPVDLNVSSRFWHLGHTLSIIPQPDFLILADIVMDFVTNFNKTMILNPGSFVKDFTFYIIYPSRNVVEPCRVNL